MLAKIKSNKIQFRIKKKHNFSDNIFPYESIISRLISLNEIKVSKINFN